MCAAIFLDHCDTRTTVLIDLIDIAPSINRMLIYAARRLYAIRGRSSLSDRRFSSSVMVLKSSLCHLGKMRSVGSGVRHSSPRTSELSDTSLGARAPSTRFGRSLFLSRSNGLTASGILLQYPNPRFPRTSISRIVSPKPSSSTISTSRNSRRRASSGLSPVLPVKRT
jgi:hypothetical protein